MPTRRCPAGRHNHDLGPSGGRLLATSSLVKGLGAVGPVRLVARQGAVGHIASGARVLGVLPQAPARSDGDTTPGEQQVSPVSGWTPAERWPGQPGSLIGAAVCALLAGLLANPHFADEAAAHAARGRHGRLAAAAVHLVVYVHAVSTVATAVCRRVVKVQLNEAALQPALAGTAHKRTADAQTASRRWRPPTPDLDLLLGGTEEQREQQRFCGRPGGPLRAPQPPFCCQEPRTSQPHTHKGIHPTPPHHVHHTPHRPTSPPPRRRLR